MELQCQKMNRAPTVEEIQDMVEHYIMAHGAFEVAKNYVTYRYTRSEGERFIFRQENSTLSAIRWICMGVIRMDSSTLSLAFVMAAMILVMSKPTSAPFLLMIFMVRPPISSISPCRPGGTQL